MMNDTSAVSPGAIRDASGATSGAQLSCFSSALPLRQGWTDRTGPRTWTRLVMIVFSVLFVTEQMM